MIRIHCWITDEQFVFLRSLKGKQSEYIRQALEKFMQEKRREFFSASASKGSDVRE